MSLPVASRELNASLYTCLIQYRKSSRSSLAGPSAEELSMELESIRNSHAKLLQELKETIAEKGRERQKHEKDLEEVAS